MTRIRFPVLALLLVGCMTEPAATQVDSVVTARSAGRHYQMTLLPSGDTIRYVLYVPTGLEGGAGAAPVPLVVAAHFGGQVTPWLGGDFADLLIVPAFSGLRSVIVAPDAGRRSGWSAADEAGVMWLAARLREVYPIDPAKVVMTGFSAGGAQTWLVANRNQDFFTAAIPVSARPRQNEEPWRIPVRVVHSRDDELIAFSTVEAYVSAQQALGAPMQLQVVNGVSHYQTSAFVPHLREAVAWLSEVWR
jgi:poly(3-hydroxybutyrate) depolymerase